MFVGKMVKAAFFLLLLHQSIIYIENGKEKYDQRSRAFFGFLR